MTVFATKFKVTIALALCLIFAHSTSSQELKRDLQLSSDKTITVLNRSGRIAVRTAVGPARITASSPKGVSERDIKIDGSRIEVKADSSRRIDLILDVPDRSTVKIETVAGAIDISGDLAAVAAKTETGTIAVDVPVDDLRYKFEWTESRPRFLADFELEKVRERSAGRSEIKGRYSKPADSAKPEAEGNGPETPKDRSVSLELTTSRGIILVNVPPNEVTSDLRERPLTNAAKAIIRSGDSLLMEAIRRAAPRYFGDYARTLPPIRTEPTFSTPATRPASTNALVKTALVRATDIKNRAIPGLRAEDFEVTENGVERQIISVERSEAPFNLVLLLDVSGSVENYVNFIRKAARNFVDTVEADDKVAIVIFSEDVKLLSTFTTDKAKLSASLDTFDAGGATAYYDALAYAVADTLRPLKGERTAIVILTDGDDNRSFLAFDSLTGSIQESGALIYPLYVPSGLIAMGEQSMSADIDPLRKKYMSLTAKSEGEGEKLAAISGGVYYSITQLGQIQNAYEDIVLQMRSAYNVTFRSSVGETATGGSPRLKVRVKRENVYATVTAVNASR